MRNMLESIHAVKTVLRATSVEVLSNQLMKGFSPKLLNVFTVRKH